MSTPTWGPVSGPPPSKAKAKTQSKLQPQVPWAPPSTPAFNLAPPAIKIPYNGVAVTRSEYTCLTREDSNALLTACGRLLFLPAITVTDNPEEVTCCFCRMRLKNEPANV